MASRVIERVEVFDARSLKRHAGGEENFVRQLEGRRVRSVARRGKFLWAPLSDAGSAPSNPSPYGEALVMHLGMSGQLRVRDGAVSGAPQASEPHVSEGPAPDPVTHLRIRLHMEGGARIDFVDQRIFGGMHVSPLIGTADARAGGEGTDLPLIPQSAAHIARDLLDPFLDEGNLVRRIRMRTAPIKSVILDQSTLSGIGNIYADEGLWEARLHFARPAIGISSRKVKELLRVCRDVMQRALEVGGTSFDALYVNVDGRSGYLDIDVERVEGSRAHEGRDCLCRASAMRRQAILRSDLARRALDKQLNGPAHLVAHRHKVGSRSLRGVACA